LQPHDKKRLVTAKEILTDIYTSEDFAAMMRKVDVSKELKKDLQQHVFCELLQKPEQLILDLYNRKKLRGYISSMVWSISRMKQTNSFARQFGVNEVLTNEFTDIADERYSEMDADLSSLSWYDSEVLRLYAKLGSYRAVANDTGIPLVSIFDTVKRAKTIVKNDLK